MDVFTRAGLQRIAVACGATGEDVASGDAAEAVLNRWLDAPVEQLPNAFDDLLGYWYGLDEDGALPFVRFAGFIEVAIQLGYVDLSEWVARDNLRFALDHAKLGDDPEDRFAGLAVRLRKRLTSASPALRESRDPAGVSAFESYLLLDTAVQRDLDLRQFLKVTHGSERHATTDALFLAAPEYFAEALAYGRVKRLSVEGQVSGALNTMRALERLARVLDHAGERRETLLRHARWGHQVDQVLARLERWVLATEEWDLEVSADDQRVGWRQYMTETGLPLVEQQRAIGLLASATWRSGILVVDLPQEPTDSAGREELIYDLTVRADVAAGELRVNEALDLYARAAQMQAERLNHQSEKDLFGYWYAIDRIQKLGDVDTAAALCAVAYPAFQQVFGPSDYKAQQVKQLMEELQRRRSAVEIQASTEPTESVVKSSSEVAETRDRLKREAAAAGREQVRRAEAAARAAYTAARDEAEKQGLMPEQVRRAGEEAAAAAREKVERIGEAAASAARSEIEGGASEAGA